MNRIVRLTYGNVPSSNRDSIYESIINGSWLMVQGSWLMPQGSWLKAIGSWPRKIIVGSPGPGPQRQFVSAMSLEPRALRHEP